LLLTSLRLRIIGQREFVFLDAADQESKNRRRSLGADLSAPI